MLASVPSWRSPSAAMWSWTRRTTRSVPTSVSQPRGRVGITDLGGAQFGIAFLGRSRGSATDNVIQGSSAAPGNGATFFAGLAVLCRHRGRHRTAPSTDHRRLADNLVRRVVVGGLSGPERQDPHRAAITGGLQQPCRYRSRGDQRLGGCAATRPPARRSASTLATSPRAIPSPATLRSGPGGLCVDDTSGSGTAGDCQHLVIQRLGACQFASGHLRRPVSPEFACEQRPGSTRASLVRTPSAAPPGRPDLHR